MGIHGFYSWLIHRYPIIRHSFHDISRPIINNLYIDFTHIIYQISSYYYQKNDHDKLFDEILRRLDFIIQMVRPTGLVFISMDGTPPMHKVESQRKSLLQLDPNRDNETFNYFQAVSGTQMMDDLDKKIRRFLKNKTKTDTTWMNVQVIYSSVYQSGEAEHKILQFIKNRSKTPGYRTDEVNCILTTDSDLIPLIMLTPEKNFLMLRQKSIFHDDSHAEIESDYEILYINILREIIQKEFTNCDPKTIFQDWAVLLLFLGNDFMENFPNIEVKTLPQLMNSYLENIVSQHLSLLNERKELNLYSFYVLIKGFYEKNGLWLSISQSGVDDTDADELCVNILNNFNWILKYYFDECPSWSYAPKIEFPTITALLKFFQKHSSTYRCCQFDRQRPLTPLERLLGTYSPSRGNYLPQEIVQLASTTLKEYYPIDSPNYEIYLPYDTLIDAFSTIIPLLSNKPDNERNRVEDDYNLFENGKMNHLKTTLFDMVAKQSQRQNLWIPSINRINGFLSLSIDAGKSPTLHANFCDNLDLNELNRNLVDKVILVDYPFLKPLIVKKIVVSGNPDIMVSKYSKKKKITIEDSGELLVVHGYLVNFSSTNHLSLCKSSKSKKYPYCLTAPLLQNLENVLDILNVTPNKIRLKKNQKVIVMRDNAFFSLAEILDFNETTKQALIQPLDYNYTAFPFEDSTWEQFVTILDFAKVLDQECFQGASQRNFNMMKIFKQSNPDQNTRLNTLVNLIQHELFESQELILSGFSKIVKHGSLNDMMVINSKKLIDPFKKFFKELSFKKKASLTTWVFSDFVRSSENSLVRNALRCLEYHLQENPSITSVKEKDSVNLSELFIAGQPLMNDQQMVIGSRVISISDSGPVPPYQFGTVVGLDMEKQIIMVIMDNDFDLGSYLRMRIATKRGIIAKFNDFMLVSSPETPWA